MGSRRGKEADFQRQSTSASLPRRLRRLLRRFSNSPWIPPRRVSSALLWQLCQVILAIGATDQPSNVMNPLINRRRFLRTTAAVSSLTGLGELGFLSQLRPVAAEEANLNPDIVRFNPEIEPLVRFLEDTPRERLLEEVGAKLKRGLSYRDLLAALLLAGVRNIQPRPVGFKFHAVLVVNSAHLASLSSPDAERWLPIFWALDHFKSSQAQDVKEGDWTMRPVDESKVPTAEKAKQAFIDALENWDEAAADAAVSGLVRSAGAQEIFELFCRYGSRDFRELGHKAIFVANSWRTLQSIGWHHAEPVLRSLAYALLDRAGDGNPGKSDLPADRPGRRNLEWGGTIRADWSGGKISSGATREMLNTLRHGSAVDTSGKVVELLKNGVAPQSLWDALFDGAGELLIREPGIRSLHAVTCTNALHFEWQHCGSEETRKLLLLQSAAFLPLFRGNRSDQGTRIDQLEQLPLKATGAAAVEEIFAELTNDRMLAARKVLAYLKDNPHPQEFIDAARVLIFLKGRDAHDYKFSSAVLEDYRNLSPAWRDRYLAASVFNLRGSGAADNQLVKRTRAALQG